MLRIEGHFRFLYYTIDLAKGQVFRVYFAASTAAVSGAAPLSGEPR